MTTGFPACVAGKYWAQLVGAPGGLGMIGNVPRSGAAMAGATLEHRAAKAKTRRFSTGEVLARPVPAASQPQSGYVAIFLSWDGICL